MTDDRSIGGQAAHTPGPPGDDDQDWMTMFSALDDREVERLLAGTPTADAELAPIAELVAVLRRSAASEQVPPMTAALRAQMGGAPTVALAARRAGRSALFKAAAAASAVAVVGLGVGASQNRLPSALQDVLHSTANFVGLDVPSSAERGSHSNRSDEDGPGQSGNSGNDGEPGHDGTTPGGATPADPGTPGDHEPAVPATPPDQSNATPGDGRETPVTSGEGTAPTTQAVPVTPDPVTSQQPVTPEEQVTSEEPAASEEPQQPGKASKPEQATNDEQGATASEQGREQEASVGGGNDSPGNAPAEPGPPEPRATGNAPETVELS